MKKFLLICISVMTFFALGITSFASESYNYPSIPSSVEGISYDSYIVQYTESGVNAGRYFLFLFNKSDWTPIYQGDRFLKFNALTTDNSTLHYLRVLQTSSSSSGWVANSDMKPSFGTAQFDSGRIFVSSNIDIYNSDNELVFPLPPSLKEVTEEGLLEMTSNLGGVMKTITLCGVGCLALLIGCSLLRKKSVLWLNR